MNISVTGRHMSVGQSLTLHIEEALKTISNKYLGRATDAIVVLDKSGSQFQASITLHAGTKSGITIQAEDTSDEAYAAFDGAATRLAKQLRRYKNRLTDHHLHKISAFEKHSTASEKIVARTSVSDENGNGSAPDDAKDHTPLVIAETNSDIKVMSVKDAVMLMDISLKQLLVFKNSKSGQLNVVYRRPDGNIGWVEPDAKAA